MQSRGCFASAFALKTFNGVKLCGHLLWSEASILHKDIYICCMENCGILYVAVILRARMWIEVLTFLCHVIVSFCHSSREEMD